MYALVLLTPIFFMPWASDALNFSKQALLIFVVFLSLFAWMIKTLVSGKFTLIISKTHLAVGFFLVAWGISTLFSTDRYASFWGWSQITSYSFISVLCFGLAYFLMAHTFNEQEAQDAFRMLGISSGLVLLLAVLQMLGLHVLPFAITKTNYFNTIGSLGGLGVFATAVLPFSILFFIGSKKWWRLLFLANIVLVALVLVIVNYPFLWWLTAIASVAIILFWIVKRNVFDGRWMFLPTFFLILSLFFMVFSPQIRWLPTKPLEFVLTYKTSYDISLKTLKASPVFGSGPGTFSYDFLKYRDASLNNGVLWNINFDSASSRVLVDAATTGILGLLALLVLMVVPLVGGIKNLVAGVAIEEKTRQDAKRDMVLLSALLLLIVQTVAYFLYNSNISLDVMYFFAMAVVVALVSKRVNVYTLKSSSLITLGIIVIFTVLFIFGLGFLLLEGQRYVADVQYYQGLSAFRAGDKTNAIIHLKKAVANNHNADMYLDQLALISLSKLQDEVVYFTNNPNDPQVKTRIQGLVSDALTAASLAVNVNSNNVENWSTKGYVCQNLVGFVADAVECAIASYDKAITLSPTNPYLLVQEGNTYILQASNLQATQQDQKTSILNKAKDKFNAAIAMKKGYVLAYYELGLAYRGLNDTQHATEAFLNAESNAPLDAVLALQIGLVYYQDKNWGQAQSHFQKALALAPDYANALYFLGLAYDQQGQKDKAIMAFSKVLELNLGNDNVQKVLANLKAGKTALTGLVVEPPAPLPPETPENPIKKAP